MTSDNGEFPCHPEHHQFADKPLRIEAGKVYRARNNALIGPMSVWEGWTNSSDGSLLYEAPDPYADTYWQGNGTNGEEGICGEAELDLVAKWPDYEPEPHTEGDFLSPDTAVKIADYEAKKERCPNCKGTGLANSFGLTRCAACNGTGHLDLGDHDARRHVEHGPEDHHDHPAQSVPVVTQKSDHGTHRAAAKLPVDAAARKALPICTGVLDYFPDALAAVAEVSRIGNDQHNPGQPLHWAMEKSTDHADCAIRHFLERGTRDTDGGRHTAKAAWRVLAHLQMEIKAEEAGMSLDDYIASLKKAVA